MNFPHQPEQLTAVWLTDTLRQAGVLHKAQIVSFEGKPLSAAAGLLGQNMIIRLAYDAREESAPQSLFAKFALADAAQRANWRTSYVQEVLFYQQFAQQVALPTPRAYFSQFDEETGYFLLLLEDCSDGEVGDRELVARWKGQDWLSPKSPDSMPPGGITRKYHRLAGNIHMMRS